MRSVTDVVQFGKTPIEYRLRRSKTRSTIAISVGLQEGVEVVAPSKVKRPRVAQVVRSKAHWIVRQKRDLTAIAPPAAKRLYRNGESILILGQNHILRVQRSTGKKVEVDVGDGDFIVKCPADKRGRKHIEKAVKAWLRQHARNTFHERIQTFCNKLNVEVPPVHLRTPQQRWASCTPKGEILVNWQVIAAPAAVVDYVLAHEVAHLFHPRHDAKFWQAMKRLMPDYKGREAILDRDGPTYLFEA